MRASSGSKFRWPARDASAEDVLRWALDEFGDKVAISTSFQATGMVILDMAACLTGGDVRVFSLDTGRIHQETYDLIVAVRKRYGINVEMLTPDSVELSRMLTMHGPNLFYEATAKRRLCCEIRKVRPLKRKLATLDAWIVGLRKSQSQAREALDAVSLDEEHGGLVKIAPLANWSEERVWDYIRRNDVPYHKLYDQNYPSIGCAPCTRPTKPGEPPRAGRWWWEDEDADKECGIHVSPTGQLRRSFDVLLEEVLPPIR
ncbi:MAG: phosphoadenylyl-sulfate reductase [Acidobacteria bacterium]|nr:phosphoadenylyl-sulfate reductase [Acidobacteriota bacterium]